MVKLARGDRKSPFRIGKRGTGLILTTYLLTGIQVILPGLIKSLSLKKTIVRPFRLVKMVLYP